LVHTITSTLTEPTATWSDLDRHMMLRALELARKGVGLVSPGPLVGCVIVDEHQAVVGEGFYVFEEVKHAETIALAAAGDRARGGTAYVSLEPHAHHGRTGPCTDALLAAGIKRVVAPIQDLNRRVSGKGFEHLASAGVEVQTGLMANEATRLNEAYLHLMRTGRPFVHLKMAVSLDGKIATRTGDSRWVAGPECRSRAHELRHEYDAILVGSGTATIDDPLLTDRSGLRRRRPLVRVVLDNNLQVSIDSQLVRTAREAPVIVVARPSADETKAAELDSCGVEVVKKNDSSLTALLDDLGNRSIQSLLIEGGANVAGRFVEEGLVNKFTFFVAPKIVGGREAPSAIGGLGVETMNDALALEDVEVIQRGDDIEITGYPPLVSE
jgi:diaminohydroxyphosphoribosylaminopyrimidine deaminase / 5-amino-6-(5-phosphoribosylamino)uracil reductase